VYLKSEKVYSKYTNFILNQIFIYFINNEIQGTSIVRQLEFLHSLAGLSNDSSAFRGACVSSELTGQAYACQR